MCVEREGMRPKDDKAILVVSLLIVFVLNQTLYNSPFWGLVFFRLGVKDSYVWGLVFLRLRVRDSYVWPGLIILTFGGCFSYVWGLVILTFGG